MSITKYGQFVRDLRKEHNETIKDAAKLFEVSVPFISAVENGKKQVPKTWCDKLIDYYDLQESEIYKLKKSIWDSREKITFNYNETIYNEKLDIAALQSLVDKLQIDDLKNLLNSLIVKLKSLGTDIDIRFEIDNCTEIQEANLKEDNLDK